MNNKILITVKVPMLEKEYDVYVPISKKIVVVIDLISKAINELTEDHFPAKNNCMLISKEGNVFDMSLTVKEVGLKNGDLVILI